MSDQAHLLYLIHLLSPETGALSLSSLSFFPSFGNFSLFALLLCHVLCFFMVGSVSLYDSSLAFSCLRSCHLFLVLI